MISAILWFMLVCFLAIVVIIIFNILRDEFYGE